MKIYGYYCVLDEQGRVCNLLDEYGNVFYIYIWDARCMCYRMMLPEKPKTLRNRVYRAARILIKRGEM